jgi:hypothetical protein
LQDAEPARLLRNTDTFLFDLPDRFKLELTGILASLATQTSPP